MFSVRLNNTQIQNLENINDFESPEIHNAKVMLAESLKKDIENTIRDIAKNIAPANTQLFNVQFNDN